MTTASRRPVDDIFLNRHNNRLTRHRNLHPGTISSIRALLYRFGFTCMVSDSIHEPLVKRLAGAERAVFPLWDEIVLVVW